MSIDPLQSLDNSRSTASRAHSFAVCKVERDQADDYARRKGWTLAEAERWLAPILNYEPTRAAAA